MASNVSSSSIVKKDVDVRKKEDGRFGFSFDLLNDGTYQISSVSFPYIDRQLQVGDWLLSVNGVTKALEQYCNSAQACSLSFWRLEIGCSTRREPSGHSRESSQSLDGSLLMSNVSSMTNDSLSFSLYPSTESNSSVGQLSTSAGSLIAMALDKPVCVIWSDEKQVSYTSASLIYNSVKFKKKESGAGQKRWILLKEIKHTSPLGPNVPRLEIGDWMLSIDGTPVPFLPSGGVTIWFHDRLHQYQNRPITFTIKKPISPGGDVGSLERTYSVHSIRPPFTDPRSRHPSAPSGNRSAHIVISDPNESPKSLKTQPEYVRQGVRMLHKTRTSIQVKAMEKLCRYRILFHHICQHPNDSCDLLQYKLFGNIARDSTQLYGDTVKEYHTHASLSEDSSKFLPAEHSNCSAEGSACSFEMHETVERIFEKAAIQGGTREYLLNMPDHISSGPLSIGSLRRFSNMADIDDVHHRMHIEVLSLTGPNTQRLGTWCSPLMICKHSINVIVVDAQTFLGNKQLEMRLSNLMNEIHTYTSDFTSHNSSSVDGKVLLVITNSDGNDCATLTANIQRMLKPHIDRLLLTTADRYPFAIASETDVIRNKLLSELRAVSDNAQRQIALYPHIAVMLSQQLTKDGFQFVETSHIQEELLKLVADTEMDQSNFQTMFTGTLHYLQNVGLAYVPELSYSSAVGKACPTITHSLLIRPYRMCEALRSLMMGQYAHVEHGLASEVDLRKVLLHFTASEKIIGILKELHILMSNRADGNKPNMLFPLICKVKPDKCQLNGMSLPALEKTPNLVLSYRGRECFLLITSFLNRLSLEARTCNVDYHNSCGRFDLFDCDICVKRTASTKWGLSKGAPAAETNHSLSIYIISLNSVRTSIRCFVRDLVGVINDFHKDMKRTGQGPIFGPPCPLEDNCRDIDSPFHIINILPQSVVASCSGINLEKTESVTGYMWHDTYANTPTSSSIREEILGKLAYNLPQKILKMLDEHSQLGRNWIGLATERNYSQSNIDQLGKQESPTYSLLVELSHVGYSIKDLIVSLNDNDMERLDVIHEITEWIDLEVKRDI